MRTLRLFRFFHYECVSRVPFVFLLFCFSSHSEEYFNPALLNIGQESKNIDGANLDIFTSKEIYPPGNYNVDIFVNNVYLKTHPVVFVLSEDKKTLLPQFDKSFLKEAGVKDTALEQLNIDEIAKNANFNFNEQKLLLILPQAIMDKQVRGNIPVSEWNNGIPAFILNYSYSSSTQIDPANTKNSQFINMRPGFNYKSWRLRNYSTYSDNDGEKKQLKTIYSYLERNVETLKSNLLIGDGTGVSDVFDSVPFRGVQLSTDDEMLADSAKGYAPIVKGIARTNAKVIIKQNGYNIYQGEVSPGAFEINDLYPTGGSGDLSVIVQEADGSEQHFVVPFASLPILQRAGRLKYSLVSGEYRSYDKEVKNNFFSQASAIFGLTNNVTVYAGTQLSGERYQSYALGVGNNFGFLGAISADVTLAKSKLMGQNSDSGQSVRALYSKELQQTGTYFSIAGYKYTSSGFYELDDVLSSYRKNASEYANYQRKERTNLSLNQRIINDMGFLSMSFVKEKYWKNAQEMQSVSFGYNNSWNGVSYGLTYSDNKNSVNNFVSTRAISEKIFSANVSIPFVVFEHNISSFYGLNSSKANKTSYSIGLNGTALQADNLSWGAQQNYDSKNKNVSGSINTDYKGTYGELTAGYAYDETAKHINYGLQGGVVAHPGGVTFGQPLGETIVIVEAANAAGINVLNETGVKTDFRGYAIVPYVNPYRVNDIGLNVDTYPDNVEINQNIVRVIPTRGAVVTASFKANVGHRILFSFDNLNGKKAIFGSVVSLQASKDPHSSFIDERGNVYMTGMPSEGVLNIVSGTYSCQAPYTLSGAKASKSGINLINLLCK